MKQFQTICKKTLVGILIFALTLMPNYGLVYAQEATVDITENTSASQQDTPTETTPPPSDNATSEQATTTDPVRDAAATQLSTEVQQQAIDDVTGELSTDSNVNLDQALQQIPFYTPTPTPELTQNLAHDEQPNTSAQATTGDTPSDNSQLQSSTSLGNDGSSLSVVNDSNGAFSNNNGSATITGTSDTTQNNTAVVATGLTGSAVTGSNDASYNVGNSTITTQDANATGTIVSSLNTNTSGVLVNEFNIADDHTGDFVLDFNSANCIIGCSQSTSAQNTNNGTNSTNNASTDVTNNTATTQNNNADVTNDMVLLADSGNNDASFNTNGDTTIQTGDANIAANVLTFANNNIGGNVVVNVINIFGDLIGDIIFPEDQMNACCPNNTSVANTNNGANTTNNASSNLDNTSETFQNNDVNITNNLIIGGTTGANQANYNTDGNSTVTSGNTNVDANVLNVTNTNVSGGNMWLVLINEAGNWVGKILGLPEGQNVGGSEGLEFNIDGNGFVSATNNGNGAASKNTAATSQSNNTTTTQNNDANIVNNLDLTANTGGNTGNFNTGGDTTVTTGDANIVANMINFVNNNISGGGKLFVTVVNVFGSWVGDFVGPGQTKQAKSDTTPTANQPLANTNTGGNTNNQSQNSTNTSSNNQTPTNIVTSGTGTSDHIASVPSLSITTQFPSSGVSNGVSQNEQDTLALVNKQPTQARVLSASDTLTAERKTMTINLAWLVLVGPLFALSVGLKKFFLWATR